VARRGEELTAEATALVVEALRGAPQGLTNAEVDERTGLNLPIPTMRGFITWTILQHLVQQRRVRKDGRHYRLIR
jgi:hypothetical protein